MGDLFFNFVWVDGGTLDYGSDASGCQIADVHVAERAAKTAERGAATATTNTSQEAV